MVDRKNATATHAGVLRPEELAQHVDLTRLPCAPSLDPWIENYWLLRWELPSGRTYSTSTLPHPACTLSIEHGHLRAGVIDPVVVTGVLTKRFDVTLAERGWVFGIKFRPGGYASLTDTHARSLRDVPVASPTAFRQETVTALAELGPHHETDHCRTAVDTVLAPYEQPADSDYLEVLDIVSVMLHDRSLVRVGDVEQRCGIGARRLQRLFERYVGVTPKWVLGRYRIHDAVSDLDGGFTGSLADLAARYGWFDQAHFTREFTELIGVPPSAYLR
ncbi:MULTISPECIES: helix-turn-helix transcriptional regulator [unclassified Rhodococcus (in: high G+C Gram-positive bacteria)]|uniref:helix-turn-helix transcriptional regulator n=1 Tax=unclassified Rhodococcus (in: high G+C Gram-positive bacteria) TaxID=192944 RepID=UPI001FF900BB|nr:MULTISPECIES: helix-turn-helix transcriptional regulator [unclassified Rhodococcus (in: high G+C Gram-positive bacteria)]